MATTMTRWHPLSELEDMRRRMEHLFEDFGNGKDRAWSLAIDLVDHEGEYVLKANIPGVKPEDIEIEVDDDVLTVAATLEETEEEKKDDFVRRERHFGSFSRSISLPKGVSPDDIEASCHDGVLEVKVPKPTEEERKPVTIKPKAA